MRGQDFLRNISNVDNDLIVEAEASMETKKKRLRWTRWFSIAACFFLVALIGVSEWRTGLFNHENSKTQDKTMNHKDGYVEKDSDSNDSVVSNNTDSTSDAQTEYRIYTDSIDLPKNISNGVEMDMIGCLVYKGKVYTQTTSYYNSNPNFNLVEKLVGVYVGEAKGTLNEWSTQSDYATELASTYSGSVYKVKGYSEDFRLCIYMKAGDESWIDFLDNYDAIGLNTGEDLFEKRMHITDNIESVSYLTHYDWNEGDVSNCKELTSITMEQFENFLNELDHSPFERIDDTKNPNFYDTEPQGHLYLNMRDGTCVEMRLIEGGYVGCQNLGWIYVKMPGELFDLVLSACQ